MKKILDELVKKYETEDFVKNDPVRYLHRFKNPYDIEIAGFIASMFAYGKRELFLKKLDYFFEAPFDPKNPDYERFKDFDYRFSKGIDLIRILEILSGIYVQNETLGSFFRYFYEKTGTISGMLQGVCDYFYANVKNDVTKGFYHLIPNPSKGGAMKRMNMMLRWFVRKSPVDRGIWTFIDKSELIIPLDVHVARISRMTGLLTRKSNDFLSAKEITENLKVFDPIDPVKYDFAIFGAGVEGAFPSIYAKSEPEISTFV